MSNQVRKTIGRQLNSQIVEENIKQNEHSQIFTLKTGRKVRFIHKTISAAEVQHRTFVNQDINGRDQAALTKESLKEIINTFRNQQFFPCIGIEAEGSIEILDGSRRRASALFVHRPLDVMVTNDQLTAEEARQLAKDIQTAKEHNLREIGLRLLALKDAGLNQKEIAERENISQAKVTRAMQAAAVPQELVSLFPVQSELSFSDYKLLLGISESLSAKGFKVEQLIDHVSASLDASSADSNLPVDLQKANYLKVVAKASLALISAPAKDKAVVSPLWIFGDKDKFARKKIKGRTLSYEFNRLPSKLLEDIDEAINQVLKRHLG
ncbi:ParB family protein [Scandinavium sp. NPDC088450]|uniref:ParB family protein n=1 Tax=Scandinavium sp. NPDC088450 TaxID=3364514 RepID=UPI00384BD5CD